METALAVNPERRSLPLSTLAAMAIIGLAVLAAYAPNVIDLIGKWNSDPNYSHGFLVVPIALAIAWVRRAEISAVRLAPWWLGWPLLGGVLALRSFFYDRNEQWWETATIPLAVAALVLAFGGWRLLWKTSPAVAFLWFMLPLPPSLNAILASPLQTLATICSTTLLQALGLPVLAEGNVIIVGTDHLEVARACNGLSMMLSFVTLITATVLTVARDRPLWERIVLMISTVPIALVANILRIAATAWAYYLFGAKFGDKIAHDTAGWAMMPIALVLVWIELKALSWLIIEEQAPRGPMVFFPTTSLGPQVVKK
jgi:exosortase